jgi:hypothetical protein
MERVKKKKKLLVKPLRERQESLLGDIPDGLA